MNSDYSSENAQQRLWTEVLVVTLIGLFMTIGLFLWNAYAGVAGVVGTIFLSAHSYIREREAQRSVVDAIETLDLHFDEVTKNAVFGMPFPMTVLDEHGLFLWYNSYFKKLFHIQDSLLGQSYDKLFADVPVKILTGKNAEPFRVTIGDRIYLFYNSVTSSPKGEALILLYGIDNSDDEEVRERYHKEQQVLAVVVLDNYDEVRATMHEADRPLAFAKIDGLVNRFAADYDATVIKYESDRYLLVCTQAALDRMKIEKFRLLEQLKTETEGLTTIRPTASIGVGYGQDTPAQKMLEARSALDIALARGGDQAVLKSGEQLDYYGGKNQATQRMTKVKARVMSNTMRSFVEEASNVLIMGHQNADMDSLGSCLGMLTFAEQVGGDAWIVLDEVTASIENLYNKVMNEAPDLAKRIIRPQRAMELRNAQSLIVVLDNHRHDATAEPKLLDEGNRVIIIDHHRRGAGYIQGAEIAYIEPYASSTSEMVTELISYQDSDIALPKVAAEALLAGITVDTKNFFYQTGTRTFEAAAYLKAGGADSVVIKELFKDDFDLMRYRSEILVGATHFAPDIMIGRFPHDIEGSTLIASQAADDLLGIRGIKASFVLTLAKQRVHISARSLGDISVQLIMEKLGGGGHLTSAATQLNGSLDEAQRQLEEAINAYLKEEKDESNPA
ncbi:DHH family phosphoesterase [Murdochiella sp. Marseille-P8839]|nr:DHH family phosphoesterase [Murdochiella sp. Marseille-P8839]